MVRYTGRARTRTGSVNTNQLGLKMSGCPSTVGKQGRITRYMGRRVDCMMGLCKPIRYHEVLWPRTRMRNQPPFCRAHATKCQAAAGGVGTNHNIPYYRIPKRGESGCTPAAVYPSDPAAALQLLRSYFQLTLGSGGSVILVGRKETLAGDGITAHFDEIKHYYSGTSEYSALPPNVKVAVDIINNLGIRAPIQPGGTPVPHVVGWESFAGQQALLDNKYGLAAELGKGSIVRMFGSCGHGGQLPCYQLWPPEADGGLGYQHGTCYTCNNAYVHPAAPSTFGPADDATYTIDGQYGQTTDACRCLPVVDGGPDVAFSYKDLGYKDECFDDTPECPICQ